MRLDGPPVGLLQTKQYDVYTRLFIAQQYGFRFGFSPWLNYSDLNGQDMLLEAAWGEEIDQPNGSGTFNLFRERGTINTSPLVNTKNGKPWPYVPVMLQTACVNKGSGKPSGADSAWQEMYQGYAMNVNIANDEKSVSAQVVIGGPVSRKWLWPTGVDEGKTSIKFGSDGGTRLDVVMQDIITYMFPTFSGDLYDLWVPDTPNFFIKSYPQAPGIGSEVLINIANQIGWDFRYRYDGAGTYRPTLIKVDRNTTTPDLIVNERDYIRMAGLDIDGTKIRTLIELYDANRNFYKRVAESASIYGDIPMRLVEEKTSHIDTPEESEALLDAVESDVSEPPATQTTEWFYHPLHQLNDLHFYVPNDRHYDEAQLLAISSVQHRISVSEQRTTTTARGKPAAAFRRWEEGTPQRIFVSLNEPTGTAPEGAEWYQVTDLTFPG